MLIPSDKNYASLIINRVPFNDYTTQIRQNFVRVEPFTPDTMADFKSLLKHLVNDEIGTEKIRL